MKYWTVTIILVWLALALAACAPKASPAASPGVPAVPLPAAPAPAAPAPAPSPEDAAWARVLEAAKKEGNVNVYTWGWTGDIGLTIAKVFKDRYGITLDIITGRGAEFLERIKTETRMGQVMADMWEGASSHSENMKLAGLLEATPELPVLRDKAAFSANPLIFTPEGYYLMHNQFFLGVHVNTNQVKPAEEPKAWADLLDPKWKGRIIFSDPVVSIASSYFAVLIDQKRMGLDYLEKLGRQNLLFDPSTPGVALKLSRGDAAIGYFSTNETTTMARQGAPIKIVDTREGIFANGLALGRVKGGPHPNATRVLLNWILSQEGQDVHSKAKGVLSVRKDVPDYQHPAAQLKPQYPVFISAEYNDLVAKVFREKTYVPLLKPK